MLGSLSNYSTPIITAVCLFPIIAFLFTLPFLYIQYHKFGAVPWFKALVVYSFVFYLICIYFLVILPLPARHDTIGNTINDHAQLRPLYYWFKHFNENGFSISSVIGFFKSRQFIQLAFNVVMTIPFGIYLKYYFKKSISFTLLTSFLLSLFFEITQLTGLYFIYPGPYRCFDVDDLICNTLGGGIGAFMAPMVVYFLPSRERLDQLAVSAGQKVSQIRLFYSVFIDVTICGIMIAAIEIFLATAGIEGTVLQTAGFIRLFYFSYFVLFTIFAKGTTPGKNFCNIRLADSSGKPADWKQCIIRYGIIWFVFGMPHLFNLLLDLIYGKKEIPVALDMVSFVIVSVSFFYFFVMVWRYTFGKKPLIYERLSHTDHFSCTK